jgi:hypothetical protein
MFGTYLCYISQKGVYLGHDGFTEGIEDGKMEES